MFKTSEHVSEAESKMKQPSKLEALKAKLKEALEKARTKLKELTDPQKRHE
jgi:ElaB/YqjD/DUF883 family membrane-anchored ribosome-binding protein